MRASILVFVVLASAGIIEANGSFQKLHFKEPKPTPAPDFDCSDRDGYFSHPVDCSAFYQCDNGYAWFHLCADGLLFNPVKNACDWPENVNCKPGGEVTENPKLLGATLIGPDPDYNCDPEVNGAFPHLQKCEYFYDCWKGNATLGLCTDVMLFDLKYNGCNYAEDVDCGDRTRPEGFPTMKPTTTTTQRPGPPFDCPQPNGHFPDPQNCRSYFVCSSNNSYYFVCPDNLVYNINLELCDHRYNVDCGDRPITA
jgi:hypothetical protein